MIHAIAIDDEPPALKIIENYCQRHEAVSLLRTFTQPAEALQYLRNNPADLLFIDIQMPGMTGLQLAEHIRPETIVVFTTAFEEYALTGYNLNAVDYLLKPFSYARFCQAITKVQKLLVHTTPETESPAMITVRADYSFLRIPVHEINYIEAMDDYVKFYLQTSERPVVVRSTMKGIEGSLPPVFLRVHRSFIVHKEKITGLKRGAILLGSKQIPIGIKYSEMVKTYMKEHLK